MTVSVSGRHVEISDAFKDHVHNGLEELWKKYHITPIETQIILSKEGPFFLCQLSAKLGKSAALRCQGKGEKGYASFDNALITLGQRLRRHREKLKDLHHHSGYNKTESLSLYVLNGAGHEEGEPAQPSSQGEAAIIAEVKADVPLLSVSEAVMEMDLADREAFVFRNKMHNQINVIYRRRDGHIGWIDPSGNDSSSR